MPTHKTEDDLVKGNIPAMPRMRVEKNATPLNLSTTWQRIYFGDSNAMGLNTDTFPMESNNQQTVTWDNASGLFKFNAPEDRNYTYSFYSVVTCSALLGNLLTPPIQLQYRFVIPNGLGAGQPLYFPNPHTTAAQAYGTLGRVNMNAETRPENSGIIYANAPMRSNGVGFELRLTANPAVAGQIQLTRATALIYGR